MIPVKLTNIPRQDMPRRGRPSVHVYPFYDPALSHKYGRLTLPAQENAVKPAVQPRPAAFQTAWYDVQFTHFDTSQRSVVKRWDFSSTQVQELGKDCFPSDKGSLHVEDLGADAVALMKIPADTLGADQAAPADTLGANQAAPSDKATRSDKAGPSAKAVPRIPAYSKPDITDTRSIKFKLDVSPELRKVLRHWNDCKVATKNEAIARLNKVDKHDDCDAYSLFPELCNSTSPFVLSQGKSSFTECPSHTRRAAVVEAVANRKARITNHFKTHPSKRKEKIEDLPLVDSRSDFLLTFPASSGSVFFEEASHKVSRKGFGGGSTDSRPRKEEDSDLEWLPRPQLYMCARSLNSQGVSPIVKMFATGQNVRRRLFHLTSESKNTANTDETTATKDTKGVRVPQKNTRTGPVPLGLRQMPREWCIQRNECGDYYLIVHYKIQKAQQKDKIKLKGMYPFLSSSAISELSDFGTTCVDNPFAAYTGDLLVRSCDPGVRNPLSVYSSDGTAIDLGNAADSDRLKKLRLESDRIKGKRMRKKGEPVPQEPDEEEPDEDGSKKVGQDQDKGKRKEDSQDKEKGKKKEDGQDWDKGKKKADGQDRDEDKEKRKVVPFHLPPRKRRHLLRRERRVLEKHSQLVLDFQQRVANYLATTSDIIIMPKMETSNMISKKGRTIRKSTKRALLGWSHCAFLRRLFIKCHDVAKDPRYPQKVQPTVLLAQPEGYTSKSCGRCGCLNDNLGAKKVFTCPQCGYTADRDHNGAFNMIIKAIR